MRPLLIYCYDAYCGWCYGFGSVMRKIETEYANRFQIEVLSGGMILPSQPTPIGVMASYIESAYPLVEQQTGVVFGDEYLWHIRNPDQSDWFPHSELPAIALCVFKSVLPEKQVEIASAIQHSLFAEGRDLTDPEAYRHLLQQYRIDEDLFYERLKQDSFKVSAYQEFEWCKRLQVTGYPQLFCQLSENRFQLLASGYTDEPIIHERMKQILDQLT